MALGWELPAYVLDLYVEFRNLTNGLELPSGRVCWALLVYHGLDGMDAVEKDYMRQLAMRGAPYTEEESLALLDYCESDVVALDKLLNAMLPGLDVPRAVHRGRFMMTAAHIERNGIPIDTESLATLRENWEQIQSHLIQRVDVDYGVYEGRTFKTDRFLSIWTTMASNGRASIVGVWHLMMTPSVRWQGVTPRLNRCASYE